MTGTSRRGWFRRLLSISTGRFGLAVVLLVLLTAAVSLVWTPFDPQQVDIPGRWAPPGWPPGARPARALLGVGD